jgi:beta-N-acetylhexosaminidase
VAVLGRAAAEGLLAGGVLPVIKHMPGHGRARSDSHQSLPVVDAPLEALLARDFAPFRALADLPLAMTAHIVFTAIDPAGPATTSATVIGEVIRNRISFDGVIITDDLSMHALSGSFEDRTRAALAAGCDVALHCNGVMEEMTAVAAGASELTGQGAARCEAALSRLTEPEPFDIEAGRARLAAALEGRWAA